MNIDEASKIANEITNNAINVNKASKTRLEEIQNIEELVNNFISYSNNISVKSNDSMLSTQETSQESTNIIKLIETLFDVINEMSNSIKDFSIAMNQLNEKNSSITELVQVNDKISMQTNLLAINAAIEASKAKEFGRGFAIVASEVKKLAAASKQSTANIGNEVNKITIMTNEVTNKNTAVQELVQNSVNISKNAILKLKLLIEISKNSSENAQNISNNVNQQLQGSDIIKSKITNLVNDTKKAIEGSNTNIILGQKLIKDIKI